MKKTFTDTELLEREREHVLKRISDYVENEKDKMFARQIAPYRKIPEGKDIDVITRYDRAGTGTVIAAKGAVPKGSYVDKSEESYELIQLLDGYDIHEKDLKTDPQLRNRTIDIVLKNMHRKEDDVLINGASLVGMNGLVDIGNGNPNGKGVASGATGSDFNNAGAWDGSDATEDPHSDVVEMIERLDDRFEPAFLCGSRTSLNYLNRLDSERQPFWKTIADLFEKKADKSFMKTSYYFPAGKVYLVPKDMEAFEMVVSENPSARTLPIQRGGMYPVEMYEWMRYSFYFDTAIVELDIS